MDVREALESLRKDYHVAGMAAAVVKNGSVVCLEASGLRNVKEQLPMSAETVMPIGSITKSFTALALGMLVEEGKLDWDVPVKNYLPSLKLADPEAENNVTVRDILCHRSGVPRYDLQLAYDAVVNTLQSQVALLSIIGLGSIISFGSIYVPVMLSYICGGALVGAVGSAISTRKYINV